ncbi:MAG: sigma-54 dependent transcriptional regulator [Verrucomicrobia bacterium]|nr:sigma-54 dependent transcriptional regulator [Verrucomicrobiota bacterium]
MDDDDSVRKTLCAFVENVGMASIEACSGEQALMTLRDAETIDFIFLDLIMPDIGGMEVLKEVKKIDSDIPVIVISGFGTIETAVESMKLGAFDFLCKPFDSEKLRDVINRAVRKGKPQCDDVYHSAEDQCKPWEHLGISLTMREITSQVELVAPTDYTVIISGETGTGKEVVARAIHERSQRKNGLFIPVDCGSIAPTLLESELFGHEKGAFTGATSRHPGKFEAASDGTLFLDEISNLPSEVQPKLLRTLQEKTVVRVGGNKPISVDIRIIVATNRSLSAMVRNREFRRDLYYRLSEFEIDVPPLRQRREDIRFLAKRFTDQCRFELNKDIKGISDKAQEILMSHEWPGNIRELRNVIRRAVLRCDNNVIEENDLDISRESEPVKTLDASFGIRVIGENSLSELKKGAIEQIEKKALVHALKKTRGNMAEAARILETDYKTVHSKVKRYIISIEQIKNGRNTNE